MFEQRYTDPTTRRNSGGAASSSQTSNPSAQTNPLLAEQWRFPTWLTAAVTPEAVRNELVQIIPEFVAGSLLLQRCEAKRLRFRASKGVWVGTYLLTIEGLALEQQIEQQIVPVQATLLPPRVAEPAAGGNDFPFAAAQWRCYLPNLRLELRTQLPDTELAMLPQLTDPETARQLLQTSIRSGGATGNHRHLRIHACTPKVMRYKPGSRCTVLYHLDYGTQAPAKAAGPAVVVAKTYNGDKGQNAFDGMRALWRSPLGTSRTVAIAEPLAYVPELSLLVQGPIRQGLTLKELIRQALKASAEEASGGLTSGFAAYIRKTAAGLAELHQCGVHSGETVTWADELAEIYQLRAELATPLPHLAQLAEDLLDRLQSLAATHPADPLAPAHRSFRPAQVLLHQGEIGFIDFDGFCQAEPALDLALFMTTVKSIGLNKPTQSGDDSGDGEEEESELLDPTLRLARLTQAEAICDLFLTEYEKHAPVSRTRIVLWETLNLLSLVLGSWTKLKLTRLENCLFLLERHVERHGLAE